MAPLGHTEIFSNMVQHHVELLLIRRADKPPTTVTARGQMVGQRESPLDYPP